MSASLRQTNPRSALFIYNRFDFHLSHWQHESHTHKSIDFHPAAVTCLPTSKDSISHKLTKAQMHFENCWHWSSVELRHGLWLTKRDLWMWLMQCVLEPPGFCTVFIVLCDTLLTLQLITVTCWILTVPCLLSSLLYCCLSARKRDPILCPLSPAAS